MPKVSIIIRTKNEERWIVSCLKAVFSQDFKDFEVILVDNCSQDKTVEKASQFKLAKIITCENYKPGLALNLGIRQSSGKYIVCLSGHCIPIGSQWLSKLIENFKDEKIAGVYGRQQPLAFTPDSDKRDLAVVFGLDKKIQVKDSFFHNANSMVRRDLWEKMPFDEAATNIEDRIWAKQVIDAGYHLAYEPEASAYHYHGIHQDGNPERCANVVRILEKLGDSVNGWHDLEHLNVVALIPVKGQTGSLGDKSLLAYTIESARESQWIKKIIVSTDSPETADLARKLGAETPFMREAALSEEYVSVEEVLRYSLEKMESVSILPDVVVTLEPTFPFRPAGLIDDMVESLVRQGLDCVIACKQENRHIWRSSEGRLELIDAAQDVPRKFKEPSYLSLRGLGCVTLPHNLRGGLLLGGKTAIYQVSSPLAGIEVRSAEDLAIAETLVKHWRQQEDKNALIGSSPAGKSGTGRLIKV